MHYAYAFRLCTQKRASDIVNLLGNKNWSQTGAIDFLSHRLCSHIDKREL